MITIKTHQLKAVLCHSAVKDIRYYLNSVCLQVRGEVPAVYLCATDGTTLFAGMPSITWTDIPQKGDFDILIPADTVKAAIKANGKNKVIVLSALPDGRYSLGDVIFSPTDGKFPDWERVVPESHSGETGQFNADLLARCQESLNFWIDQKNNVFRLLHNGQSTASFQVDGAVCVVMPCRVDDPAPPIPMPSSFKTKQEEA